MSNILKKIVQDKKETINLYKKSNSIDLIEKKNQKPGLFF